MGENVTDHKYMLDNHINNNKNVSTQTIILSQTGAISIAALNAVNFKLFQATIDALLLVVM